MQPSRHQPEKVCRYQPNPSRMVICTRGHLQVAMSDASIAMLGALRFQLSCECFAGVDAARGSAACMQTPAAAATRDGSQEGPAGYICDCERLHTSDDTILQRS